MSSAGAVGFTISLGVVSKLVLFVLLLFSVVSWAVVFLKWKAFRSAEYDESRFHSLYARSPNAPDLDRYAKELSASPSAAVYLGLIERVGRGGDELAGGGYSNSGGGASEDTPAVDRRYIEQVAGYLGQAQISRLEDYLPFLATTGNLTPFIGLLGTVMGIIDAFREIGRQGTASLTAVAPGVAEALVATAAGLVTAIPAVIAYNYFLMRIRKLAFRTDTFTIEFLNALRPSGKQVGARV